MPLDTFLTAHDPLAPIEGWFTRQGWLPQPFQRQCWQAYLAGESGLLQVPTGSGKTYAAVMGPIAQLLAEAGWDPATGTATRRLEGLRLLVLTPLRALSRDLARAIEEPITAMGWPLRVGIRNGDTSSYERGKQLRTPPQILITTPESLSVLLANPKAPELFADLQAVVIDEWHELMGSKRGVQTELCLSWLRQRQPQLCCWAISATIGNLEEAARAAVGQAVVATSTRLPMPRIITGNLERPLRIRSLLPERIDGFPWAGHLGLRMYEELVAALDPAVSTLLFTNTRNQAERWYQCLRFACPEMEGAMALHHSAIDRSEREAIEAGVKEGTVRWVVCTSSLDLGVDFQPVERVVQIGSARNLARLLQRAGRSGHCPGGTAQVLFMPTNALELLEVSAMRRGLNEGLVETRQPPRLALDVLLQHLTTLACGPGFDPQQELAVVRTAWSFRELSDGQWQWCLDLLERGGHCLSAYPRYRKVVRCNPEDQALPEAAAESREGAMPADTPWRYRVLDRTIARLHRFNIGTITADRAVTVRLLRGAVLGQVEEAFISRLKPGDVFFFAGRQLEFVRLREMTAQVKASTRRSSTVPAWSGGQLALSDLLSRHLRLEIDRCARAMAALAEGENAATALDTAELRALEPLLRRQIDLSRLPRQDEVLLELCHTREGSHLFVYPFEGRFVHEGLGLLWAWRLARHRPSTITVSVNDYGLELLAPRGYGFEALLDAHGDELLDGTHLSSDLEQAMNLSELCRRRFRAIAQVSGLINPAMPGQAQTGGQLQISAALLFDVFSRHEPDHLLLDQARREVLLEQLELPRLQGALERLAASTWRLERPPRPGPLAFPLLAERLSSRMSNESVLERLQRWMNDAVRLESR
jgi:ATP-dependent Lhr-like helicase